MANAVVFSPNFLGKRGSHDIEMELGEPFEMDETHIGSSQNTKRLKLSDKSWGSAAVGSAFGGGALKRNSFASPSNLARGNENVLNDSYGSTQAEIIELKLQHSQLTTKLFQAESLCQKRDQEVTELRALAQRMSAELQKRTAEKETLSEENKLLKKAVHIQDAKIRDLAEQVQRSQEFISAATAYIEEAEREKRTRAMSSSISNSYRPDFYPPQPPPDVF